MPGLALLACVRVVPMLLVCLGEHSVLCLMLLRQF